MKWDWKYLSTFEPAVLRGVWIAIVGLLTAFGLQVTDATQAKATALIAAAAIIVPLVQAFWTRQAVSPVAKLTELEEAVTTPAPAYPSLTGPTIGSGQNVNVSIPGAPPPTSSSVGGSVPFVDDPGAVVPDPPPPDPAGDLKKQEEQP